MLKMDQKGHKAQKGLKVYERRQKIEFSDLKNLLLVEFSLAELGGIEVRMNCSD